MTEERYWESGTAPDTRWTPTTREFRIQVNKTSHRIRFIEETESEVTILIEPHPVADAADTGPLSKPVTICP